MRVETDFEMKQRLSLTGETKCWKKGEKSSYSRAEIRSQTKERGIIWKWKLPEEGETWKWALRHAWEQHRQSEHDEWANINDAAWQTCHRLMYGPPKTHRQKQWDKMSIRLTVSTRGTQSGAHRHVWVTPGETLLLWVLLGAGVTEGGTDIGWLKRIVLIFSTTTHSRASAGSQHNKAKHCTPVYATIKWTSKQCSNKGEFYLFLVTFQSMAGL